jgi:hypothetical protein
LSHLGALKEIHMIFLHIPALFKGIEIFPGILKFVFIYFTISFCTPNDVTQNPMGPQNPGWEIL